jgi:lysophospholipase L1-like esterase
VKRGGLAQSSPGGLDYNNPTFAFPKQKVGEFVFPPLVGDIPACCRRRFLSGDIMHLPVLLSAVFELLSPTQVGKVKVDNVVWTDVRELDLEGQGWKETKAPFDRLPAKAEKGVREPVWNLSRHSAGLCVRFAADAPVLQARWTLTSSRLAMPHMPATGVSGLDLYVKTAKGKWRWLGVGQPKETTNTAVLAAGISPGKHEYLLYLPLYNGISKLEIGLPQAAKIFKPSPRSKENSKPIVFYGTSITQGGCASRPGMVHTAILGRWLDHPVINLGFSGNGRMELELAHLLAELDPAVYVLDCLPNMTATEVTERVEPFVHVLRKARPHTPILLVEDRSYANALFLAGPRQRNSESRAALKGAFARLTKAGVANLHYLPGEDLLGDDGEGTVDSSHPTDLGFIRQAEAFAKVLQPLVKK